jgi:hypothetical protein
MADHVNTKPRVGFFRIKHYKIFDSVNAWCDYKNLEHHNDYNYTDKSFLVYIFSVEDAKQIC